MFNYGNHLRDFTYFDDIVEAAIRVLDKPAQPNPDWNSNNPDSATSHAPWRVYNIGSNNPVELKEYVSTLESALGRTASKELLPLQPGDVPDTYADVEALIVNLGYKPETNIRDGIEKFVAWFRSYYQV